MSTMSTSTMSTSTMSTSTMSMYTMSMSTMSMYTMSMSTMSISTMSVSSPDDKLSENIWFVWFKTSYDGDKWRCHHGDERTNERTNNKVKIELVNKLTKDC